MPQDRIRVENPQTGHTHTPITIDGQQICSSCRMVVINPILSHDDERLHHEPLAPNPEMVIEAILSLGPKPLDFTIIELCERLGLEWPHYIEILSEAYGGENPPHTEQGSTRWD